MEESKANGGEVCIDESLGDAARRGDEAELVKLLGCGANPLAELGLRKMTALMKAAEGGHAPCVEALMGVSGLANDKAAAMRALCLAIFSGNVECVKLLATAAVAMDARFSGRTALMMAAVEHNPKSVELLIPLSDPLFADNVGMTALMHAAEEGHVESVKMLMPVSDLHRVDSRGVTALQRAANSGSEQCVEALLDGSDADACDLEGNTALMMAACAGSSESVRLLLAHGADPLRAAKNGMTALMCAANSRREGLECVELLLPVSNLGAVDETGRDAVDWADESQAWESGDLMRSYGRAIEERDALDSGSGSGKRSPLAGKSKSI